MKINPKIILVIIFLLTLGFRLYISFTNTSFSSDDSYFNLRLTEHIIETKEPLTYDQLSYGGRNLVYPQAFNYFLALFSFIPGYEKIIPALLSSLIIIIVYLISKKITNNGTASLFSALLAAFIPIEVRTNINQISVYSLVLPILLLLILCLLSLENKKYFILFIILSFLFPLIHPISILFMFSLLFYLILINTESINVDKIKKEAILFSFFVILVINFFLYREALLRYGVKIIWQNIPTNLFNVYFKTFNAIEMLYLIGIFPLILGITGIYIGFFKKRENPTILLTSFILSTFLLITLKLINLQIGLLFLSIPLLIAASSTLSSIHKYFTITKFAKYKIYFNITLLIFIIAFSLLPSYFVASSLPNFNKEVKDFKWINENTAKTSTILTTYDIGNTLTYFSDRKNVADSNFILAPNAEEKLNDINLIYKGVFEIKALELIKKYDINYIYAPPKILQSYNITKISYIDDEKCFNLVKEDIYEIKC